MMDGLSPNAVIASSLALPVLIAGALAPFIVVLVVLALRRSGAGVTRLLLPIGAMVMACLAVVAILERMAENERSAERRALEQRNFVLTGQALAPGSALGCLDSAAGEKVESACEKALFADPQSVAGAVAYVTARLALLADGLDYARRSDPAFADTLASVRRAIELDRFGIAAYVLSSRDGCTADRCAAFALLRDSTVLKANLKVSAYSEYVARHVAAWNGGTPTADKQVPVASLPTLSDATATSLPPGLPPPGTPVPSRYDFPSAASIPPVSIMNAEPSLPPGASAANAAAPPSTAVDPGTRVPVPPRRPQMQAPTPPAR
jgi:hypothetical protein